MNPATLRQIITQLENACFHISLEMPGRPEDADTFCAQLQRALDETQQRLDDLREVAPLPEPPSLKLMLMHPCEQCGASIPLDCARCAKCVDYEHISGRRPGTCPGCGERAYMTAGLCLVCQGERVA